jgi:hypothetical protein
MQMKVKIEFVQDQNQCLDTLDSTAWYECTADWGHYVRDTVKHQFMALVRERTIPSDCRLSAKLVPTIVDRGVLRGQHDGSPIAIFSLFYTGSTTFSSK